MVGQKKLLVLFTNSYPYGEKESYLESEILFAGGFDRYIIVPCFPESDFLREVDCKENFLIIETNCKTFYNRVLAIISTMFDSNFWKEVLYILNNKALKFDALKKLIWFTIRSQKVLRCIENKLLKELYDYDDIVLYSYWMVEPAYICSIIKKRLKSCKHITRCHGYDIYEYRNEINYLPYRKLILKNVDLICTVSKDGISYLLDNYQNLYIKDKLLLSYLGTLADKVDKKKFYYIRDDLKIVSCSNLVAVKRVGKIIEALSMVENINITWNHYGDGELKEALITQATHCLKDNIKFCFHGRVNNSEMLKEYQKIGFDIFINVSESEGLPVSIMEAMSYGIPVIATDVGGTSEIVIDGYNGFLLDKDFESNILKDCIYKYFYSDPCFKLKLRKNAIETWEKNFDAKKNYKKFYSIISSL